MTQFENEHYQAIKHGLELFNSEKFWECHEYLEDEWMELRGDPVRNVFWAVIQAATVLVHVRNENLAGAQGMLKKTLEKLERVEKDFIESDYMEECLKWNELKAILREIPKDSKLLDFERLMKFKFPKV
ncbi:MAG: hypothetical protein COW00_07385 [Bdellovibrio sp. CG12_big_fil_rev_8_21_14_0_65_39_13]|nr:MAG: hypothetical protein COW78_16875 [Bdellovibrio sp. CG22_combo_CG10-13_8_21_14_all_39_27]PIQ60192.1 MAG: hypothetical protein COW00_07385 [Bdellovibrio sp. CG12_big_fil_rev_8_21_14_0_65_39_13]PIR36727.1 MAG: hypothetical protein COV37_01890 [Bdellovibrio sp. CG11_big_fil_rev_8_21_14_0_20_39_38]PJB52789.1 MAG: hypothetical protein CO099_10730 [Bdellovibrio sp. CG_4_9_14_3_um_filter_39_7]